MSLVFLPRINSVAVVGEIGIVGIERKDRDKSRYIREPVIPNPKQSEPVLAGMKHSLAVELVLLPMFQPIQESVAIRSRQRQPRFWGRAQSHYHIDVSIISGKSNEGIEFRS